MWNFLKDPIGDTAVALLKAGAETDKKDVDGFLALDLAPDEQVSDATFNIRRSTFFNAA